MSFADQIREFAKVADERTNLVVKKIIFDIGTGLVMKSPVGDPEFWKNPASAPPGYVGGRLRANWQYAINAPDITNNLPPDKTGQTALGNITAKMPESALGLKHYITNSVPYIVPIENGHSWRQAPTGVVMNTQLEFEPIVAAAVAELKSGAV